MDLEYIDTIIEAHQGEPGSTISILGDIQDRYHYLPEDALRMLARKTGIRLVDIYGVATFYKAFSLKPKGKHIVSVCVGTACHVRGAQKIAEGFTEQLGIAPGETTSNNEITFETVNCLGACALGPIVVSDGHYFANVTTGNIGKIIRKTKQGVYRDGKSNGNVFPIEAFCPLCNRSLMDSENLLDGYPSIFMRVSLNGKSGWMRMPSLYGRFIRVYEHEIPKKTVINLLCPHCQSILQDGFSCIECGAPLASIKINGGNSVLRICTRAGCSGHLLELNGMVF